MARATSQGKKPANRAWNALTPPLAQWILNYVSSQNYARPTPVQAAVSQLLRGNKDTVVEAVTGSGKTLAFLIPVVEKILNADELAKRHHVQAVIISPTRELATQTYNVVKGMLAFHQPSSQIAEYYDGDEKRPATTESVVVPQLLMGGRTKSADDLSRFMRLSPNLLIGTPGRLAELLSCAHVKTPASCFEILIMDEADRLLEVGRFDDHILPILKLLPKQRRTGLFSASMNDALEQLIKVGMLYPHRVTCRVRTSKGGVIEERKTPVALQMSYLVTPCSKKIASMYKLLAELEPRPLKVLVFLSTCAAVQYFHRLSRLIPPGFAKVALHGKLTAEAREKAYLRFTGNTQPTVLLTTDVASRGLDVPNVDLVIMFDPPADTKTFIHRAGRAGRAGRKGLAVVFLQPGREENYVSLMEVRQTPITPLLKPAITVIDAEAAEKATQIRAQAQADRDIFQLAQRAFVSWVRAYSEHQAKSIFDVHHIDWVDAAHGFGLLQLPKMPELRTKTLDRSLALDIDVDAIAFKDATREKKRLEEMAAWRAEKESRQGTAAAGEVSAQGRKRKKNKAWSAKHDKEELKLVRREKRQKKQAAGKLAKMTEEERLEQRKLEDLISEVRKKNATEESNQGAEFAGFDD